MNTICQHLLQGMHPVGTGRQLVLGK